MVNMARFFNTPASLFMSSILMTSLEWAWSCRDCDNSMKKEIDSFYDFYLPHDPIEPVGPCSDAGNNQIAKTKRPVFVQEPWISERSSCPWEDSFDEDLLGIRYPCRLHTARLTSRSVPQRCFRRPGRPSPRTGHQFCEPLLQNVPVIIRTGCQQGCHLYERRNFTVNVGFTCVMYPS